MMNAVAQDPAIYITGGLDAIGEDFLMVPFVKPSAVQIRLAAFNGFGLGLRCRTTCGRGIINL